MPSSCLLWYNYFFCHRLAQLKFHDKLTDTDSHFPSNMKKALLQNAVFDFDTFKFEKSADQLKIEKG